MSAHDHLEELIAFVNHTHQVMSLAYFDTQDTLYNLKKMSLQKLNQVAGGLAYVYQYRLYIHENINDYLYQAPVGQPFLYRVKTRESIDEKNERYVLKMDGMGAIPVNKCFNDIMGFRVVIDGDFDEALYEQWKDRHGLMHGYLREDDEYVGYDLYFKSGDNRYFPWELQIWRRQDAEQNIASHREHKRIILQ
jgi:hypothetical protein